MRVLLHFDNTDLFADLVAERFPDAAVACCNSYDALPGVLEDFAPEAMFCIKFENRPYPRDAVQATPSLRWVSVGGVGVDHLTPWDPSRLTVTNGSGVASEVMGHYVLGGMLALAMRFPQFLRKQAAKRWQMDYVGEVAGRTVTIVGLGHTGRTVARLAAAVGLRVVGTRANPAPTDHVTRVYGPDELHAALAEGDFVVISSPLLPATRHLIDAAAFAAMKPGAFLVDVSRGGVVDSQALTQALQSGRLGGAVLDVFETEPMPADSPIWAMDNVIVTPHCSSVFTGWERRAAEMFCNNLDRWRAGEPLLNVVDPARGY